MRRLVWVGALVLTAGACTSSIVQGTDISEGNQCPITIPSAAFAPPEPYPQAPLGTNSAWYGTEDLWTVLSLDGSYTPRKSVWWSVNFPGGIVEESPNILVIWSRLGSSDDAISNDFDGTNAHTPEDGDFMIAGNDPRQNGCWEVYATYKGATLSYVYDRRI